MELELVHPLIYYRVCEAINQGAHLIAFLKNAFSGPRNIGQALGKI